MLSDQEVAGMDKRDRSGPGIRLAINKKGFPPPESDKQIEFLRFLAREIFG